MSDFNEQDRKHIWHPFTQHHTSGDPLGIVRAEGTLLFDKDGKEYIDVNSSWWVNTHGHGHHHIGAALSEQFETLDHVVFAGITHPKAAELAERITKKLPEKFERVFFSDNGSTAIEVALKMTFQYWFNTGASKFKVLAIEGAYHGDTFGAMSVGQRDLFNRPFEPFFFDVDYLPFPTEDNKEAVLREAEERLSTGQYSSFIAEPLVQGASGMRMYSADVLDQLVRIAKKYETFVIFDEVMTGFGRTGKMFALDHCEETPDLIALSKGLTAGVLPMGLTITSNKMFEAFLDDEMARGFLHGHSFTGNPLACTAACASLDLFEREETWNAIDLISEWNSELETVLALFDNVVGLASFGTILRFEVKSDESTYFETKVRSKAYDFFLENGMLIRPLGNVIFINPPYCITKDEYTKVKTAILEFLSNI